MALTNKQICNVRVLRCLFVRTFVCLCMTHLSIAQNFVVERWRKWVFLFVFFFVLGGLTRGLCGNGGLQRWFWRPWWCLYLRQNDCNTKVITAIAESSGKRFVTCLPPTNNQLRRIKSSSSSQWIVYIYIILLYTDRYRREQHKKKLTEKKKNRKRTTVTAGSSDMGEADRRQCYLSPLPLGEILHYITHCYHDHQQYQSELLLTTLTTTTPTRVVSVLLIFLMPTILLLLLFSF